MPPPPHPHTQVSSLWLCAQALGKEQAAGMNTAALLALTLRTHSRQHTFQPRLPRLQKIRGDARGRGGEEGPPIWDFHPRHRNPGINLEEKRFQTILPTVLSSGLDGWPPLRYQQIPQLGLSAKSWLHAWSGGHKAPWLSAWAAGPVPAASKAGL